MKVSLLVTGSKNNSEAHKLNFYALFDFKLNFCTLSDFKRYSSVQINLNTSTSGTGTLQVFVTFGFRWRNACPMVVRTHFSALVVSYDSN